MQAADFRRTDNQAALRSHRLCATPDRSGGGAGTPVGKAGGQPHLGAGCGVGCMPRSSASSRRMSSRWKSAQPRLRRRSVAVCWSSPAEELPFGEDSFDVVFSHEVIEHVNDDRRAAAEMVRVLSRPAAASCCSAQPALSLRDRPLQHRFGNTPLINWLPNPLRNRLAPTSAYRGGIRNLFAGHPVRIIHHTVIYPGFDNIVKTAARRRSGAEARAPRSKSPPLRWFGLSHFIVLERT